MCLEPKHKDESSVNHHSTSQQGEIRTGIKEIKNGARHQMSSNGNPRELLPQSSLPWKPELLPPLGWGGQGGESTDGPTMATTSATGADLVTRLWISSYLPPKQYCSSTKVVFLPKRKELEKLLKTQ